MGIFSSTRVPPPKVPTDTVIPLREMDSLPLSVGICNEFSFYFQDVLNVHKLQAALDRLVSKEKWRKMGARLRRNKDGKLEYHIPAEFSEKRPGVLHSQQTFATCIADHPVLSQIPKGRGEKPVLMHPSWHFRPHMRGPNSPRSYEDWLYADIPQLAVHFVVFKDATIFTLTYLHSFMDGSGLATLTRAWTAVLRGEDDSLPPFIGYEHADDPLATLHQQRPGSDYLLAPKALKGWGFFVFVVRQMLERLWWPQEEARVVCIPSAYIKRLADVARAQLDAAHRAKNDDGSGSKPFVGESDVLLAWWIMNVVRALKPAPSRTVALINAFDARPLLTEMGLLPRPEAAFFGNAAYGCITLSAARNYLRSTAEAPLTPLAASIRRDMLTQRTVEQVQAQLAALRESLATAGRPPLYGSSDMMFFAYSNLNTFKLYEADFSHALMSTEDEDVPKANPEAYRRGTPTWISSTSTEAGFSPRNTGLFMGKDKAGYWWLFACLRKGAWKNIEEQLKAHL
ncbi:hypothetical protein MCOR27_001401 [Pyricularia oryzae]|uniref:LysR family regulatory protein n=2 Tax=Pyricularia TaxID=48558 RepID=A0ABQ8NCQ0_PYRGI|nr:hypothetical protein MCOR01_010309 [Pyricularia oryzae]KAI6294849.1 hypothetical protein MCOR33_008127 [Pyricularia grisea]KAH9436345.1 hypothetical protein MCOR02_000016 [Pyricularia oryzae]KAI6255685.1 hypothetical protein MCOR19_007834 [Pyricularia oryzae]KAI6283030.1 hypothetical protein MCOR26_002573 [Pyricularia oryzae]